MSNDRFIFTPDNLIDNVHKLGGWSAYGMAEEAINYYYPYIAEIEDVQKRIDKEVEAIGLLGGNCWQDVIVKYHREVGYKGEFNPDCVNEN